MHIINCLHYKKDIILLYTSFSCPYVFLLFACIAYFVVSSTTH